MENITYRKLKNSDKETVAGFIKEHWGSETVVVHNTVYTPCNLPGYIAERKEKVIGLITYEMFDDVCEIVTLNSLSENSGIGSQLLNKVEKFAKKNDCRSIWLVTTNDNIRAIEFYQKRGYQLVKVYPNAVNNSRKIKPEIPEVAANGIPIRDELEFGKYFR